MNVLIFEDEQYNYELLLDMLHNIIPESKICGPIESITEGRRYFAENNTKPDIIIADVQLNDGLSFYALTDAPPDVPIIFTTAYDEYALKAFEYNSLSYLLKPIDEEELRDAIRKTQERLITDEHRKELFAVLSHNAQYSERFLVKTFKGEKAISLSEIRYFVSEQKTTYIKLLDGTSYEYAEPLSVLEQKLNPQQFMRVNRKYIVPAREVLTLEAHTNGKELLMLRGDNPPEIMISRDNKAQVHQWLKTSD